MDKIQFTPITLPNQKPTDIKDCYIELHEKHLRYKAEFYADEPINNEDPVMGVENNVYNYFDIIALKENVSGIEISFTQNKKWVVYIIVRGFANDIKVYSRTQSTSKLLFDKLYEWLLK